MMQWATLAKGALAAIVWLVILSPALLRVLRLQPPAHSYRWFRGLIGFLIVAAFVGFTGVHWNATANEPMPFTVNFANAADARVFAVGLVTLGIAFAITSVLDLSRGQLSFLTRATVAAADLFLVGVFLGIAVATSGWAPSPFSKSYWTITGMLLVVTTLVRAIRVTEPVRSAPTPPATIPA